MPDIKTLVERLRLLARNPHTEALAEDLEGHRAEDLAHALPRLDLDEQLSIIRQLDPETAAETLVELPTETAKQLLEEVDDTALAHYLDILPMDDALELRDVLGEERFDDLLQVIPKEDAQEIRRLLNYPEDSVGRIMTEAYFEVGPEATMADILEDIRRSPNDKYEMVNDIYVLNEDQHLLGVISLRKAIRATPWTTARDVMNEEVVTAHAQDDAVEAARTMSKYGFYALPILDSRGRMVGLFTGDDAQSILEETETEQVHKMAAVTGDAESYISLSVWSLAWRRIPWLIGLFVAETLTGTVLRYYTKSTESAVQLSYFIPLLIGAGGNSGSQVTTMITRALALKEISFSDWFIVLRREFVTALIVGGTLGILGYFRATLWHTSPSICLTVGCALPAIIIWATSIGSLLPIAAKRIGLDPAVMSAPFISTFVDATGLVIFYEIALKFVGHLS